MNTFALGMIGVLMSIVIFVFAQAGFFYIRVTLFIENVNINSEDPGETMCFDMWSCFLNILNWGL